MGIRKPNLSVSEARRLANINSALPDQSSPMHVLDNLSTQPELPSDGDVVTSFSTPVLISNSKEQLKIADKTSPRNVSPKQVRAGKQAESDTLNPRPGNKDAALQHPLMVETLDVASEVNKVQVYVSALRPAPGVSRTFDLLRDRYRPAKALQMILRRALQEYDELLLTGQFLQLPQTYEIDTDFKETVIQTSRMMPKSCLAIARIHFDPLELETTRAFGRKLAVAALSAYFSATTSKERSVRGI